jgi:hypothetical protein
LIIIPYEDIENINFVKDTTTIGSMTSFGVFDSDLDSTNEFIMLAKSQIQKELSKKIELLDSLFVWIQVDVFEMSNYMQKYELDFEYLTFGFYSKMHPTVHDNYQKNLEEFRNWVTILGEVISISAKLRYQKKLEEEAEEEFPF